MKVFIVAVLIFAVCGVVMTGADKTDPMKACQEENKATDQEFEDLDSGKTQRENASQAVQCTIKCRMEKSGFIDPATGEFLPDRLKEILADQPKLVEAIDKCKGQEGANPCETAFMIAGCIKNIGRDL